MAGKPFKVGRFAHTLRVRLMREHLGVDVDAMYEEDLMSTAPGEPSSSEVWDPDHEQHRGKETDITQTGKAKRRTAMTEIIEGVADSAQQGLVLDHTAQRDETNFAPAIHATGDATGKDEP